MILQIFDLSNFTIYFKYFYWLNTYICQHLKSKIYVGIVIYFNLEYNFGMENKDLVISIDYGTQSVRVSIIDKNGKFLAFEHVVYDEPYFSIKPGYCEQNPDYYYNCMCKAAKKLTSEHQDLLERCASISSTCFRDTAVYLDENYNVIRPSIIWLDQRQSALIKKLPKLYSFLFDVVGMADTVALNRKRTPAIWLQENEPENYSKIKHYAPLNSYFNYRMLGTLTDSASNMTGHFPINYKKKKRYSKNALKGIIFNINPQLMSKIAPEGTVIGKITSKCNKETGFPIGLNYITTGNDKSCEALGCGAINKKCAHISYGTGSSIAVVSERYFEPETFLPAYSTCFPGAYTAEVQIYRGYWMLKWFLHEFGEKENLEATIEKVAPEEIFNEKIMQIRPGCDGLILQPYWGPGLSRPLAKGSIIGFYDVHTKYHIYRSIIEGIGYALKEGLESIERHGKLSVQYLTVSGGGSKSDAICQITSDLFNLPVYKSETYESSSLGCAMAQFVALGIYKDVEEAKDKMVRYVKKFTPNKLAVKEYKDLYNNIYIKVYPSLKNVYKALSDFKEKRDKEEIEVH